MIFQLIGEGLFAWDETLDVLFNGVPMGPITRERFKNITLESILTHSSGLPAWFPFYTQKDSFWNVLEFVLNKYPVQEGTVYSDLGFMLLGEIINDVSGWTLQQKLDLLNSKLSTSFTYNPRDAHACVETERGNRIEEGMCMELGLSFDGFRDRSVSIRGQVNDGNAFYFWRGAAGHAGIFGTAGDLVKLGEFHLNDGIIDGKELIPSWLARIACRDSGGGRGLMWNLSGIFFDGLGGFGHTGFTGTSIYLCRGKSLACVILTNRLVIEPAPDLKNFRTEIHKMALNT